MGIHARCIWAPLMVAVLMVLAGTSAAWARKPLLIPGKKTLYQRVVVHPQAKLYQAADPASAVLNQQIKPFSVFYVFTRTTAEGDQWLEIGPSTDGNPLGWMRAAKSSRWKSALTLQFTERAGRQPVMFFKSRAALENVAYADQSTKLQTELVDEFCRLQRENQTPGADFPLVALEPRDTAVPRDKFYLLPIFSWANAAERIKFLEVASINPGWQGVPDVSRTGEGSAAGGGQGQGGDQAQGEPVQSLGVAFVIDTTISMSPYIESARQAAKRIFDSLEKAGMADRAAFAVVAYRSSVVKTPGLGYVATVISDFVPGSRGADFQKALAGVREAKVSSHSFNEDAFAGVRLALQNLSWGPYHGRVIFLITDAGALRNDDPYTTTKLNEEEVAAELAGRHVKIFVLHMKTPAGKRAGFDNHAFAAMQYKSLARYPDQPTVKDLYVPLEAGGAGRGVELEGQVLEKVTGSLVKVMQDKKEMRPSEKPAEENPKPQNEAVKEAERKAEILGYALRLDFLGKVNRTQPPEVVNAWVADVDLARPNTPAFNICLLLTKDQISDLQKRLKIIVDHALRTHRTGSKDFFQGIMSAAAQFTRDPVRFSRKPDQNLYSLGLLGEYLEDLPYKSRVMSMTEDDWYRMSVGEQRAFINSLTSRIEAYAHYHDDVSAWESFGSSNPGDAVCKIPLSLLP